MENILYLMTAVLPMLFLLWLVFLPIRWILKTLGRSVSGLASLLFFNFLSSYTGIQFPINLGTAAIAGFFGIRGIAALAVFQACMDYFC